MYIGRILTIYFLTFDITLIQDSYKEWIKALSDLIASKI